MQAKLSPSEKNAIEQRPTTDIAAFELYSRAKDLILNTGFSAIGAQNLREGIELLNQALARDPSFFAAQCQLAYAHDSLYASGLDHTPERLALAEAAVQAAFRLRPDAGEAHLARANHLYDAYRDYDGALAELDIVRSTMPNAPQIFELTGYIARRRGAHEQGVRNLQRAVELDPRNFFTLQQLALSYKLLRRYAEEIATEIAHCRSNQMMLRPRPRVASLPSTGKPTLARCTKRLMRSVPKTPEAIKSVADVWFICALAEHDAGAAEAALAALGDGRLFGVYSTSFSAGFRPRPARQDDKRRK